MFRECRSILNPMTIDDNQPTFVFIFLCSFSYAFYNVFSLQTLLPSTPVDFAIEKITVSHEGSFLALSGRQGVAVLELPRRWGPNGQYKEGKESILCRYVIIKSLCYYSNSVLCVVYVFCHNNLNSRMQIKKQKKNHV